jgi:hypothetical protein
VSGIEGGEGWVEIFQAEEQSAGVLVEILGDDAGVVGGEIEHGEIGMGKSWHRAAGFARELFPLFDSGEMVAEDVVEFLGEMGLVENEGVDDKKEKIGDSRLGGAEEGGPNHGANEKIIVETHGAAVADGGAGDGEHGQSGGERVEAESTLGVGAEFADYRGEARKGSGGVGESGVWSENGGSSALRRGSRVQEFKGSSGVWSKNEGPSISIGGR